MIYQTEAQTQGVSLYHFIIRVRPSEGRLWESAIMAVSSYHAFIRALLRYLLFMARIERAVTHSAYLEIWNKNN
jgi:hypothetical protein